MSERSQIHECSLAVGGLQSQRKIDRNGGGSVSPLRVDDRENFPTKAFLTVLALGRGKADKSFEQVSRCRGALDELARARAHGVDDHLGLAESSDGEDRGIRHLLMQ